MAFLPAHGALVLTGSDDLVLFSALTELGEDASSIGDDAILFALFCRTYVLGSRPLPNCFLKIEFIV